MYFSFAAFSQFNQLTKLALCYSAFKKICPKMSSTAFLSFGWKKRWICSTLCPDKMKLNTCILTLMPICLWRWPPSHELVSVSGSFLLKGVSLPIVAKCALKGDHLIVEVSSVIVRSIAYNMKSLKVTVLVVWGYMNKIHFNWFQIKFMTLTLGRTHKNKDCYICHSSSLL